MTIDNPKTCGGEEDKNDLPVVPREPLPQSIIASLKELSQYSLTDILAVLIPSPPLSQANFFGGFGPLFFRPMVFDGVGSTVSGHAHSFDHVSFLYKGSVNLISWEINPVTGEKMGEPIERQFEAPSRILIKKNFAHQFTALSPANIDCIYVLRDANGEMTNEWDGNLTYHS